MSVQKTLPNRDTSQASHAPSVDGPASTKELVEFLGYQVRINDPPNFRILNKDIVDQQIYRFDSTRPDPVILDVGSNIGLTVLYFKHLYPAARIIAFEPDPIVASLLRENIQRNPITNVEVIEAGVAAEAGSRSLVCDGKYGSSFFADAVPLHEQAATPKTVACVRLREYLQEPIDFMKMNIEGAEAEVIADCEDRLRRIREMVIEYHHLPGLRRSLHDILTRLDRQGFEYLINDFDRETNPGVQPPFRLHDNSRYYLLIYAIRKESSTP